MSDAGIHYEVLARTNPKSAWRVLAATEDRAEAMTLAEGAGTRTPESGAYVNKEVYDREAADFYSVRVATFGACGTVRQNKSRLDIQPISEACIAPTDLLRPDVRAQIGRLLERWLSREAALPGELFFRVDLIEKLDAAPHELAMAIQRAVLARGDKSETVHIAARRLHDLVERATAQAYKDARTGKFTRYPEQAGLGGIEASYKADPAYEHAVRSAIVDYLRASISATDKLARMLVLWEEANALPARAEPPRAFLEEIMAEWARVPGHLAALMEVRGDMGHEAMGLAALLMVRPPDLADLPRQLNSKLAKGGWMRLRQAVVGRLIEIISGNKRLCPNSFDEELQLQRQLADAMVRFADPQELEMFTEAFARRSRYLMSGHHLDPWLAQVPAEDRLERLFALLPFTVGPAARLRLAQHAQSWINSAEFADSLAGRHPTLQAQLQVLKRMTGQVKAVTLPENQSAQILKTIEALTYRLVTRAKLFEKIIAASKDPLQAAAALLTLAGRDLPPGPAVREATDKARGLLGQPEARRQLAGSPQLMVQFAGLLREAQARVAA
jgi:hypothetical protein